MGYRLPEELRQLDIHLSSTFRDRFAWEQRHTSSIDSFMPARKQKDGECRKTSEALSPLRFRCCTHLRLRAVQVREAGRGGEGGALRSNPTPAPISGRRSPFFSTLNMTLILSGRPSIARSAVSDRITRVDADQRRPTRVWHSGS